LPLKEAEIRRIEVQGNQGKYVKPYLKNTQHKKGLAEWLKW
jgi:translation initiation factor 1 (eIF-1/SUI1)